MKTVELASVVACLVLVVQAGGPGGNGGGQGNGKTGGSSGGGGGPASANQQTGPANGGPMGSGNNINARRWLLRRSGPGGVVGAQTSSVGPVNQGPTVNYGSGTIQGNNYGNQAAPGRGGDGYVTQNMQGASSNGGGTGGNQGGSAGSAGGKGGKAGKRRSLLPRGLVQQNFAGASSAGGNTGGNTGGNAVSQGGAGGRTGATIKGSQTGKGGEGGKQSTALDFSMPMMGTRSVFARGTVQQNFAGASSAGGNTGGNKAGTAVSGGGAGGSTGASIYGSKTGDGGKGGDQSTDFKMSMPMMGARSLLPDGFEEALYARMESGDSHGLLYDTLKRRYLSSILEGREAAPPVQKGAPKGNGKINDQGQLTASAIVDAIKKKQMLPDKLEAAFEATNLAKQYTPPPKRSKADPSIASHDCTFAIGLMQKNQIPQEIQTALDDPANGWTKKGGAAAGGASNKAVPKGGKGKRDAYAFAEADAYADPEAFAEPEDYYEFEARSADAEELWAREAEPQHDEFFQQVWSRDADAEPEYFEEYWTRDAEPEYSDASALDLQERDDDGGDIEARDAESDELELLLARSDALYDTLLDVYS